MQTGDIVFVRGNSWLSDIIRWVDKGEFSHVAIAVSPTHVLEAQYNKKVNIVPLRYSDFEIVPMHLNSYEKKQLEDYIPSLVGKWYDYLYAVGLFFKAVFRIDGFGNWGRPDKVICSELVTKALHHLNIIGKEFSHISPNPLYEIATDISEKRLELNSLEI